MKYGYMVLAVAASTALFAPVAYAQHEAAVSAPPAVRFAPSPAPIPFELFRGSRIFLTGKVNGADTSMMFDSGASGTVLDLAYAEALGLKGGVDAQVQGTSGKVPGRIYNAVTLAVGGLTLANVPVIAIDLTPIARAIGRPIPVVLGRDAMKAGIMTIDFPARTIRFVDRTGFVAPAGATRLDMGSDGHFPAVKVSLAGLPPIDATLDIGNGGTLLLSRAYWEKQAAFTGLRHAQTQVGGVGGMKLARKATIPTVDFAGLRLANVPAVLNEDPAALPTSGGNLGIEMLKPFIVTIDDVGAALYLKATGARHDFRPERAGVGTHLVGDRLRVTYVSPDGPGNAAGLKVGDEILAVDGARVGPDYYSRPVEWARQAAGTKVALTRADGSIVTITLADYY